MTIIDEIRMKVQKQFRTNPRIHINVSMNRPKIKIENQPARIIGVYPNIFQIEAEGKSYTVQYIDLLTNNVRITELE